MEEYTNLSTEAEGGLFDDYAPEGQQEQAEPQAQPEAAAPEADAQEKPQEGEAQQEGAQAKPQTLRVKYNGKEQEITLDEAVTLAQKGMNYDKVLSERNSLRVDARASELMRRMAEVNGMDLEQYVGFVENQQEAAILQREAQSIRDRYPDMPEDAVNEMAQMRAKEKRKAYEENAAARRKSDEEARQKPWIAFLAEFPDYMDGRELPRGVVEGIERGLAPVEAMLRYRESEYEQRIKELETKLGAREQNQKNKKASVGSLASTAAENAPDAFLQGFDG